MKLYIKQKVFSIGDKYKIYDASGNPIFYVESELLTMAPKIHLYNMNREELFYIKKKITFFLARYEIYQKGTQVAEVEQKFTLFRNQLKIHSAFGEFTLDGDTFAHNFDILLDGKRYGSVRKQWLSWGDSYELEVNNYEFVPYFCSLVIAIDNCVHNENS